MTTVRKRLAKWLDPPIDVHALESGRESGTEPGTAPRCEPALDPVAAETPHPWTPVAQQFALRVLAVSYQASSHLAAAEEVEADPDRLQRLYRIDHAITRIRRQAENLQVLTGLTIDDAGRQVTTLLDVVRAATSAIEQFAQVRTGRIAELALVEFAADDLIRILTELLDNATRFSPPSTTVTVSAHLTDWGQVLIRVEDSGVGVEAGQLPALNAMLAETAKPATDVPATHVGLAVVQRLAATHHLRVQLTTRQTGGTIATVLVPGDLLCEIPTDLQTPVPAGRPRLRSVPSPRAPLEMETDTRPRPYPTGQPPRSTTDGTTEADLPRRARGSTRGALAAVTSPPGDPDGAMWPDEAGDFAAGFEDARASLVEGSRQ